MMDAGYFANTRENSKAVGKVPRLQCRQNRIAFMLCHCSQSYFICSLPFVCTCAGMDKCRRDMRRVESACMHACIHACMRACMHAWVDW